MVKYTSDEGSGHLHNIYDNSRGKMKDWKFFDVNNPTSRRREGEREKEDTSLPRVGFKINTF